VSQPRGYGMFHSPVGFCGSFRGTCKHTRGFTIWDLHYGIDFNTIRSGMEACWGHILDNAVMMS